MNVTILFSKSPESCRSEIVKFANIVGANYVEFQPIYKKLFQNGNYRYTMHSYKAKIGLAAKHRNEISEQKAAKSQDDMYQQFELISAPLLNIIRNNNEKRACQENVFYYIGTLIKSIILLPYNILKFVFKFK